MVKRKTAKKPVKTTKAKIIYEYKTQTGKRKSIKKDRKRKALAPGKRISKNGNIYYERRRNRSDLKGKNI